MSDVTGDSPFPQGSLFEQEAERQKQYREQLRIGKVEQLTTGSVADPQVAKALLKEAQEKLRKEASHRRLAALLDDMGVELDLGHYSEVSDLIVEAQDIVAEGL